MNIESTIIASFGRNTDAVDVAKDVVEKCNLIFKDAGLNLHLKLNARHTGGLGGLVSWRINLEKSDD